MRKLKYIVPNAFTAASLCLGLASVTRSAHGDFDLAAWMILWGVLLDKLDGTSARLLGASSGFGVQLDSFADFVVFGVAPAALVYFRAQALGDLGAAWLALMAMAGALYVVAVAARLARFNISDPPMGDRIFYGIPTTMMGGLIASGYLSFAKHGVGDDMIRCSPLYFLAGGALMVSRVRLPKLKVQRSTAFNVFQFANVAAAYVLAPLRLFPEYLFVMATGYVVVGVGWYLAFPPKPREPEPEPDREGEPDRAT